MMDWLDDEAPIEWLVDLLESIRITENLDYLLLSKRIELWERCMGFVLGSLRTQGALYDWVYQWMEGRPPANVWVGATVEDQPLTNRINHLLLIPAKVRFLSCEPLLGPLDFSRFIVGEGSLLHVATNSRMAGVNWIICGCESGPNARPMDIEWARSLRDQCQAANVPFFMKQMMIDGKLVHDLEDMPDDLRIREFPNP